MPINNQVERTLGAGFFTFVIGCILYGITVAQVYKYFRTKTPNPESWRRKSLVALVFLVDTLHSAFSMHVMWTWLVLGFGGEVVFTKVIWSIKAVGYLHVFLILLAQGIYLSQIYKFARKCISGPIISRITRVFIVSAFLLALVAVIVFLVELQKVEFILDFALGAKWILYFAFGSTAAVDIGITTGMCYLLNKSKIRVEGLDMEMQSTVVLSKIMIFFISSGLLTTIIAVAFMIMYAVIPDVVLFAGATFSTSKIYANSVLTMMNVRRNLVSEWDRPRDIPDIELSIQFRPPNSTVSSSAFFSSALGYISDKEQGRKIFENNALAATSRRRRHSLS